jgi:subtilisin family serine protease
MIEIMKKQALFLSFVLLAINFSPQPVKAQTSPSLPTTKFIRANKPIRNSYIVVLKDTSVSRLGVSSVAQTLVQGKGEVRFLYQRALKGFSVRLSESQAQALSQDARVQYVAEDGEVSIVETQTNPPWGLDRIDQISLPLNAIYNYNNTGAGVNAYVIDTGILTTHTNFGGRASFVYDAIGGTGSGGDCNGHGTHVAGTIGSNTYGVAKGVKLYGVRVLGCNGSGSFSSVIAGVDWVTANSIKPAVANMSLGGGAYAPLDTAVRNSIANGVTYVVAAGNNTGQDANLYSPARVSEAITVGATDSNDRKADFSNIGSVLDIFAPGVGITSTSNSGGTTILSGTSMASPHVAGVAALFLQSNPTASPSAVEQSIVQSATPNKVINPGAGSPNRLLYSQVSNSSGAIVPIINFLLSD